MSFVADGSKFVEKRFELVANEHGGFDGHRVAEQIHDPRGVTDHDHTLATMILVVDEVTREEETKLRFGREGPGHMAQVTGPEDVVAGKVCPRLLAELFGQVYVELKVEAPLFEALPQPVGHLVKGTGNHFTQSVSTGGKIQILGFFPSHENPLHGKSQR